MLTRAWRRQVNWPTLWLSWRERELREALVLPLIIGIMLIPVGVFSGAALAPSPLRVTTCSRACFPSSEACRVRRSWLFIPDIALKERVLSEHTVSRWAASLCSPASCAACMPHPSAVPTRDILGRA